MSLAVTITILIEDKAFHGGLKGEHGISMLIRLDNGKTVKSNVLFDTGQSGAFAENAQYLGKKISEVDSLILSHNHYDHTGGVERFLELNNRALIYGHEKAFRASFSKAAKEEKIRKIGFPEGGLKLLNGLKEKVIKNSDPYRINESLLLTGSVPRKNDYEKVEPTIFTDKECTHQDKIPDDQSLIINSGEEMLIVLGCCHSGIVNTIDYAREIMADKSIKAVIGGMHLVASGSNRINAMLKYLKKIDNLKIYHGHCTGLKAGCILNESFPENARFISAGETYKFILN
ncbi:MAG: hypothetical protein DRP57_07315 [Spirochaetes bacterium]|nr:MAG: hypothetical protein DRP57_07315 [Spirochaetota bacterium]